MIIAMNNAFFVGIIFKSLGIKGVRNNGALAAIVTKIPIVPALSPKSSIRNENKGAKSPKPIEEIKPELKARAMVI